VEWWANVLAHQDVSSRPYGRGITSNFILNAAAKAFIYKRKKGKGKK